MDRLLEIYDYLYAGGVVMLPLILASCWMWLLIFDRLLFFRQVDGRDVSLQEAVALLRGTAVMNRPRGLRSLLVLAFLRERSGDPELDRSILDRCAMRVRPSIKKSLTIIATLAAVSPLFGLLGTVTGMITTFDVIALFGTGNAKAMAGGISEALITTQSGLMVAIPALFMSTYLLRRAHRLEGELNETVSTLKRHL